MGTRSGTGYGVHLYETCHHFGLAWWVRASWENKTLSRGLMNEEGLAEQVQCHWERNQGGQTRIPLDT